MCEKETVTRRINGKLVDALTAGEADGLPSRVSPHEDITMQMRFHVSDGQSVQGRRHPGWPRSRAMNTLLPKPHSAKSLGLGAAWRDEPGLAKKKATIGGPGVNSSDCEPQRQEKARCSLPPRPGVIRTGRETHHRKGRVTSRPSAAQARNGLHQEP